MGVRRVAAAALLVAGLLAGPRPGPAPATTGGTFSFVAVTVLACPGMSYPLVPLAPAAVCPMALGTVVCATGAVNVFKPLMPLTDSGGCVLGAMGAMTGWCGLAFATAVGALATPLVVYGVDLAFDVVGATVVISGAIAGPVQDGVVKGVGVVVPPTPPLAAVGDNCALGTGTTMTIAAQVTLLLA